MKPVMTFEGTPWRIGNSTVITIPKPIASMLDTDDKHIITITKPKKKK